MCVCVNLFYFQRIAKWFYCLSSSGIFVLAEIIFVSRCSEYLFGEMCKWSNKCNRSGTMSTWNYTRIRNLYAWWPEWWLSWCECWQRAMWVYKQCDIKLKECIVTNNTMQNEFTTYRTFCMCMWLMLYFRTVFFSQYWSINQSINRSIKKNNCIYRITYDFCCSCSHLLSADSSEDASGSGITAIKG